MPVGAVPVPTIPIMWSPEPPTAPAAPCRSVRPTGVPRVLGVCAIHSPRSIFPAHLLGALVAVVVVVAMGGLIVKVLVVVMGGLVVMRALVLLVV